MKRKPLKHRLVLYLVLDAPRERALRALVRRGPFRIFPYVPQMRCGPEHLVGVYPHYGVLGRGGEEHE